MSTKTLKLSESASRALGSLLSKFKLLKMCILMLIQCFSHFSLRLFLRNMGTYTEAPFIDKLQHQAVRFFLGVN